MLRSWAYVLRPGCSSRYERRLRLGPRLHRRHALCGPCVSRTGISPAVCGRRTRAELHIQDIRPRMLPPSAAPRRGACCTHPCYSFPCSGLRAHGTLLFYGSGRMEEAKMKIGSIVVRCYEFDRMLAFWQQALHYVPREPAQDGWVVLRDPEGRRGPNVSLERVPEPFEPIGKTSRVHLDLYTNDQQGEVERLVEIGATRYPRTCSPDEDFIVLEDPDGNRFCVVQVTSEN